MPAGFRLALGFVLAIAAMGAQAVGAEWPERPIRLVVPYAAGGAADVMGRVFAEPLSAALGQQVYVENAAGAGGLVGSKAVARAEPDGYTLIVAGMASHVLAPLMSKNAGFDPVQDFTHIAYFGGAPSVILVHPSLGVKNLPDLLKLAKEQPDGISYVSPGFGTAGHIVAEYLASKEAIRLVHVPHKGGGTAIFDVIAGHVKMASMNWSTAREHILSGALVPIAISSAERLPDAANIPTFRELGYDDLVITTWYALSGPARLPQPITDRLNREVIKSLDQPRVRKHLEMEAAEIKPLTPSETARFIEGELKKWEPTVKALTPAN